MKNISSLHVPHNKNTDKCEPIRIATPKEVVLAIHLIDRNTVNKFCRVDFTKFAINGAVLGLCIENTHIANFPEVLITTLGVGLGFTLVLTVFSALEFRIDYDAVPYSFRGLPIHLLIAGMIVLALLCF